MEKQIVKNANLISTNMDATASKSAHNTWAGEKTTVQNFTGWNFKNKKKKLRWIKGEWKKWKGVTEYNHQQEINWKPGEITPHVFFSFFFVMCNFKAEISEHL